MSENARYEYLQAGPTDAAAPALASVFLHQLASASRVRTVCDLGCGNGYLSGLLLAQGYEVTGVDASDSGISVARQTHGARAQFVCAPCDASLPRKLNGRKFGAIVSSDVIEHLYHPRDLVDCARELLIPRGWLVLGTPYHGYLKNLALSLLNRWDAHHTTDWDGGHIKFFSISTLTRLVEQAGFDILRFRYFGRAPWLWKNMICLARLR